MEVRQSPIPGWAWDLIEKVERGERRLWQEPPSLRRMLTRPREQLVSELVWETRRGTRYDRIASRVRTGKLKSSDPERTLTNLENAKTSHTKYSSGHAYPWEGRITLTAGSSLLDQKMVLLHELAHLLAPSQEHHGKVWRRIVARLYSKYGGPEIVEWALTSERSPVLRRYLRERYPEAESARQVKGLTAAILKLSAEMDDIAKGLNPSLSSQEPASS